MKARQSTLTNEEKEYFMQQAIQEAKKAEAILEVPIGAVVVRDGQIIGRGHNLRETTHDATTHAEMQAIQEACRGIENWRLEESQLFVTLEPCPMCCGAILLSRIDEVYFGAYDQKAGTAGTLMNLLDDDRFNHWSYVEGGILHDDCQQLLKDFFKKLRQQKKMAKKTSQSE